MKSLLSSAVFCVTFALASGAAPASYRGVMILKNRKLGILCSNSPRLIPTLYNSWRVRHK